MQKAFGLFPDEQMLLAHGQQHRDVLLGDHMPLAEPGALVLTRDDLGQVVTQHMTGCMDGFDLFHAFTSRSTSSVQ